MADGVAITAGSGTTIATDDAGAPGHVQLFKLAISTDGSATLAPVSSTDGVLVNLGSNNDVTVTGTVDLGATDNAVLDAIAAALAGTLTVSGTITANAGTGTLAVSLASVPTHAVTQSGTWTVQPGNTANTTAWKVDGSAVTQPVSLASVPSHAVTNAGTFVTQVDGAALTALQNIETAVEAAQPVVINRFVSDNSADTAGTLSANTVKTVDLDVSGMTCVELEIISLAGTDIIYYTIGTSVAAPSDPSATNNIAGIIPGAGVPAAITLPNNHNGTIRVKLLSPSSSVPWAIVAKGY